MSTAQRGEVLVVGAGVTGLSAALFLAQTGHRVEVWEAASAIGGLLTPVPFAGMLCDRGSHRLHAEALPLLRSAAPNIKWLSRPRRGALILGGRQIGYPLKMAGFLRGLGPRRAARFGLSFLLRDASLGKFLRWEHDRGRTADSTAADDIGFAQFVRERVGEAVYEAFYRPYAEKVWGVSPETLSSSVAKKRVSTARPLEILRQTLSSSKKDAATFLYPEQGMGALIEALREELSARGVPLHLSRRFSPAELADPRFSAVVYSGNLADLLPRRALHHRGLYLLFLAFPLASLGTTDTFYAPEGAYFFGRASIPKNFSPALGSGNQSVLCVEIPEGRFGPHEDFLRRLPEVSRQLHAAGILPRPMLPMDAQQIFLPHVYPLYQRGFLPEWRAAMAEIAAHNHIFPVGRQGLFLHCNIDHCVRMAKDLSEHINAGRSARDWIATADRYLELRVRD